MPFADQEIPAVIQSGGENETFIPDLFAEDLTRLTSKTIYTLPSITDTLVHTDKIDGDISRYKRMNGLYLTEEVRDELGQFDRNGLQFAVKSLLAIGRGNSRRKVFFGDLGHAEADKQLAIRVAVKPFDSKSFHYALHETGMLGHLEDNNIPTLQLLGMMAIPDGAAPRSYMLTRFKPGMSTLDNTEWKKLSEPERWSRLRPAIDTLVELHGIVTFHGDFEFKNVAVGEEDRTSFVVDTESSVSLRDAISPFAVNEREVALLQRKMSVDFTDLSRSISTYIRNPGVLDSPHFEELCVQVYLPYRAGIARSDSPYRAALLLAFDGMLERKRRDAYGE